MDGGAAPNRAYEDFEPPLEWVKEDGSDTLLVFLPGFQKERLKIQITSSRSLKINGERPIGGTKWRRFSKEFPITSDWDTSQISAKFEGGILYVKVPKKEAPPSPSRATPHVKLPHEAATSTITKTDEKLAEDKIPGAGVSQQKEGRDDKGKEDTSHDVHKKASMDGEKKTSSSDVTAGVTQKDKHDQSEAMKKHEYGKHVSESVDEKAKEKEAKEKSKASSGPYKEKIKQSGEGSVGARPRRQSYKDSAQGLDTGFKINPRKVVNLGLIALFLLVLVLYMKNTFKTIEESTIGEL
ncbi:hypothetical protein UlMin_017737 [Ulmus minor]